MKATSGPEGWLCKGVCGVARLGRGINHGLRRAPCIHSLAGPRGSRGYPDRLQKLHDRRLELLLL